MGVFNRVLDSLIIQLLRKSGPYEHNGERLKFLADLTRNTDTRLMLNKLFNTPLQRGYRRQTGNECCQLKGNLTLWLRNFL